MYFWKSNISRSGLIYNVFYEGPVQSRKKINALEASWQDPQRLGEPGHMIFSALTGPLSCCSAWITGILCPFAPRSPGSCDQPYILPLPRVPTLSKTKLFCLMQFELGKLLQCIKDHISVLQRCQQSDLVMNSFLRGQLLSQFSLHCVWFVQCLQP